MRLGLWTAVALALLVQGSSEQVADLSAQSALHIEPPSDDHNMIVRSHNARSIPFKSNHAHGMGRLLVATVTEDVEYGANQEPGVPLGRIAVVVQDFSEGGSRTLASFSDPGAKGEIFDNGYWATSQPDCCASPAAHHVRLLATGAHLFESHGPGPIGISSWVRVHFSPGANRRAYLRRLSIDRWAALKGPGSQDGSVATLMYGGDEGEISAVALIAADRDLSRTGLDMRMTGVELLWDDVRERPISGSAIPYRVSGPAHGTPQIPRRVWRDFTETNWSTGLELVIAVDGKWQAAIPVEDDRLQPEKARFRPDFSAIVTIR